MEKTGPKSGIFSAKLLSGRTIPLQALIYVIMGYLMAALSAPPLAQMAGSWAVSRAREAREMDQEPTLPMIGTLTSVSTKKDGLEGHPGPPRHLESPDYPTARSWCRVDPSDAGVLVSQALRLARLASGLRTWSGAQVSLK